MWREGKPRAELSSSAGRSSGEWRMAGNLSRASFAATMESSTQTAAATSKKPVGRGRGRMRGSATHGSLHFCNAYTNTHTHSGDSNIFNENLCVKKGTENQAKANTERREKERRQKANKIQRYMCVCGESVCGGRGGRLYGVGGRRLQLQLCMRRPFCFFSLEYAVTMHNILCTERENNVFKNILIIIFSSRKYLTLFRIFLREIQAIL